MRGGGGVFKTPKKDYVIFEQPLTQNDKMGKFEIQTIISCFRTYMWGVIYLRNTDPAIWFDTDVKLFQVQRV